MFSDRFKLKLPKVFIGFFEISLITFNWIDINEFVKTDGILVSQQTFIVVLRSTLYKIIKHI
jgi:hypothetical protein